jgi:hypothetical protein
MARPDLTRVPDYFHQYINQVKEVDLTEAFRNQGTSFIRFLESIPNDKHDYRYAPGKWSIKEVLQHLIDTERVFCYRALSFARRDATPLPSFDENVFASNSKADKRNWPDLVEEFKAVRRATEMLFDSFDKEQLEASGTASGKSNYVLGIGYIMTGHINHHMRIMNERYLKTSAVQTA